VLVCLCVCVSECVGTWVQTSLGAHAEVRQVDVQTKAWPGHHPHDSPATPPTRTTLAITTDL